MTESENKTFAQEDTDSNTEVNLRVSGKRQTCTFKGDRKLWKAFVSYSKIEYGSVCHILEPIILAILEAKVNLGNTIKVQREDVQPIVIENLTVERVVQRHRRVYREYSQVSRMESNYFHDGGWRFVSGELNEYGHAIGCECSVCSPVKPKPKERHF